MTRTGKWARRTVWLTLAAVACLGCNPLTSIAFLLHRDQNVRAEYPIRPAEGEKSDKDKEIVVLVLTGLAPGQPYEFAGTDRELAIKLAKYMGDAAKADKQKLTVIPATQVDRFKMANPGWKTMKPAEIGKRLGADVVLDITVGNINIYEPQSRNQMYQGRATVDVSVYDTADPSGVPKHTYPHPFAYPKTELNPVDGKPLNRFKMEFLDELAVELVRKHVDHKPSDGIAAGR